MNQLYIYQKFLPKLQVSTRDFGRNFYVLDIINLYTLFSFSEFRAYRMTHVVSMLAKCIEKNKIYKIYNIH